MDLNILRNSIDQEESVLHTSLHSWVSCWLPRRRISSGFGASRTLIFDIFNAYSKRRGLELTGIQIVLLDDFITQLELDKRFLSLTENPSPYMS